MQELIFVPMLVQVATAALARQALVAARAGNDECQLRDAEDAWQLQFGLPLLFLVLAGTAYSHGIADTWVLVFAALFALARMLHVFLLLIRRDPIMGSAALRASTVALLGMAALIVLDLWMDEPA